MRERLKAWFIGPATAPALTVAGAALIADQAHKWWMLSIYRIGEGQRVRVTPFFDLVYTRNTGVSYGLFAQGTWLGQLLLTLFAVAATLAMLAWVSQQTSRLLAVSIGLIMGGAIGNAIDRMRLGGVADFFSLHAFGYYWYVFNIADVAIVAGVAGLLYDFLAANRNPAKMD